jgi:hypothetical protein
MGDYNGGNNSEKLPFKILSADQLAASRQSINASSVVSVSYAVLYICAKPVGEILLSGTSLDVGDLKSSYLILFF